MSVNFERPGEAANLPAGFSLREGQAVIVGEAYFEYEPFFFNGFIEPRTVYHLSVYRPRVTVAELGGGGGDAGVGGDSDDTTDSDGDSDVDTDSDADSGSGGGSDSDSGGGSDSGSD